MYRPRLLRRSIVTGASAPGPRSGRSRGTSWSSRPPTLATVAGDDHRARRHTQEPGAQPPVKPEPGIERRAVGAPPLDVPAHRGHRIPMPGASVGPARSAHASRAERRWIASRGSPRALWPRPRWSRATAASSAERVVAGQPAPGRERRGRGAADARREIAHAAAPFEGIVKPAAITAHARRTARAGIRRTAGRAHPSGVRTPGRGGCTPSRAARATR